MSSLEKALILAVQAHRGQVDKGGQPYILHPLRLMQKLDSEAGKIVALLHDVVEDSDVRLTDLIEQGFSEKIVSAVDALTKRPDEDYECYLARVADNKIARDVKVEDLKDNLDVTRLESLSDGDLRRISKYHWSCPDFVDTP